jgi:hypothetical protein
MSGYSNYKNGRRFHLPSFMRCRAVLEFAAVAAVGLEGPEAFGEHWCERYQFCDFSHIFSLLHRAL